MLQFTAKEQSWLDAYQEVREKKHPGIVQEILIYGSKARGQAHADSDLDVLLIVKNEAGARNQLIERVSRAADHRNYSATGNLRGSVMKYFDYESVACEAKIPEEKLLRSQEFEDTGLLFVARLKKEGKQMVANFQPA